MLLMFSLCVCVCVCMCVLVCVLVCVCVYFVLHCHFLLRSASLANSKDPDQSAHVRGLNSDKCSQVRSLF